MPKESRREHHYSRRSHDDYRRRSRRDSPDRYDKKQRHESYRRKERSRYRSERSRSPYEGRDHRRDKKSHSPVNRYEEEQKQKRLKKEKHELKEQSIRKKADFSADITLEDLQAMQAMGIPFDFSTSQGKCVEDPEANAGAIRTKSFRQARQYMNRKGGFNRPLPAEKTGQKVIRD